MTTVEALRVTEKRKTVIDMGLVGALGQEKNDRRESSGS